MIKETKLTRQHLIDFGFLPKPTASFRYEYPYSVSPYIAECSRFVRFGGEREGSMCEGVDYSHIEVVFTKDDEEIQDYEEIKPVELTFKCGSGACWRLNLDVSTLTKFKRVIGDLIKERCVDKDILTHSQKGYIYLIKSRYGYKIGKTKHPKTRNNLFTVKLPFEIECIRNFIVPAKDLSHIEKALHRIFQKRHVNGEWFNLSKSDIVIIDSIFCGIFGFRLKCTAVFEWCKNENIIAQLTSDIDNSEYFRSLNRFAIRMSSIQRRIEKAKGTPVRLVRQ